MAKWLLLLGVTLLLVFQEESDIFRDLLSDLLAFKFIFSELLVQFDYLSQHRRLLFLEPGMVLVLLLGFNPSVVSSRLLVI